MEAQATIQPADAYKFTPKYRFSCKNNAFSGVTLWQWLQILYRHRSDVDIGSYWFRLTFLTSMAAFNTIWSFLDYVLFHQAIVKQKLNPRPIFIIGHPRSGTTLIHNVLSHDSSLSFASTFQVGFPSSFCSLWWAKNLLACIIDKKRPMDDMDLHMDLPGEDEVATNMLSGGVSPCCLAPLPLYMPIFLMTRHHDFWDTFSFRPAPGQTPHNPPHKMSTEAKFRVWSSAFTYFLKKVTHWNGGEGRRLVVKSPVHTSRVRVLLEMFPEAQFIFVHRHPEDTFRSAAHLADAYYWYTYLSKPSDVEITDFIIRQMETLHADYFRDRDLIPQGNLVEVSFAELNSDIASTFQRIYAALSLPSWELPDGGKRAMEYTSGLAGFKKNSHKALSERHRHLLRQRLAFVYDDLGYQQD